MRGRLLRSAIVLALATSVLQVPAPAQAAARVRIDRIYFDSPGSDYGSNSSLNAEWIRLENRGNRAKNLKGWRIVDEGRDHTYVFGRYILQPGKTIIIHTGRGTNQGRHRYWGLDNYVWNNDGDRATLKNANRDVVDRCAYSGSGDAVNC